MIQSRQNHILLVMDTMRKESIDALTRFLAFIHFHFFAYARQLRKYRFRQAIPYDTSCQDMPFAFGHPTFALGWLRKSNLRLRQ